MLLEMWRDYIQSLRGRLELRTAIQPQPRPFKRCVLWCEDAVCVCYISSLCLQSIEGEFDKMRQNLCEFSATQTQFCQNMSQSIGIICVEISNCVYLYAVSEEWSCEQQGCVKGIQEGVEGVASLLRRFNHGQTSSGRQRTSEMQASLSQSQATTRQFQVGANITIVCCRSCTFFAGVSGVCS